MSAHAKKTSLEKIAINAMSVFMVQRATHAQGTLQTILYAGWGVFAMTDWTEQANACALIRTMILNFSVKA